MKSKTKSYTQKGDYRVVKWGTICGRGEEPEEQFMTSIEMKGTELINLWLTSVYGGPQCRNEPMANKRKT